jgi:HEAT repeat protein
LSRLTRIASIQALGRLGDVRAIEPLQAMRNSSDMRIYKAAVRALNELGVSQATPRPNDKKRS